MPRLMTFLRSAVRSFRKSPGFFLIATFVLALGIGANVAIFTVVNAVVLRPLPYPGQAEIVSVFHTAPGIDRPRIELSDGTYFLYHRDSRALQELGIYWDDAVTLTGRQEPERVRACGATSSVFTILRVPPERGRTLEAADEKPGAEPVVVLSHGLWRRRFGGDPAVLGSELAVDGVPHRIVGVMPAGFRFPSAETDLWEPMTIDPSHLATGAFNYHGIGRLRTGQGTERAAHELSDLLFRAADLPDGALTRETIESAKLAVLVRPLRDDIVGDVARVLWILLGSVGLILVIACANVANLFLVRAEARLRDVAVRSALGASRGDIIRQFLGESLTLGILGGIFGLALALAGVRALIALRPEGLPRLDEVGMDGSVIAFTFGVALLAGLLVGLLAALRYSQPDLVATLKEGGGRGGTVGRERLRARHALVVAQIALALVLLIGAGLMVKSFLRLHQVSPGIDPYGALTVRLDLPKAEYPPRARTQFVVRLLEKVRAIPGVQAAGTTTLLPFSGNNSNSSLTIEDFPVASGALPPILATRWVSPGFFEALRIPVRQGSVFNRLDLTLEGKEAVISESMARRFWPGKSPLGKRVAIGAGKEPLWYTIIGVVGSVRDAGLDGEPVEAVYFPMQPRSSSGGGLGGFVPESFTLIVRGAGDPAKLARPVREALWSIDPNLPLSQVQSMETVIARSMVRIKFTTLLLVIAGLIALLLGGVGVYGVISYMVSQRKREIGVRMALGAERWDIARHVLREGILLALAGVILGLIGSFVVTRLMAALLFNVSPTDLSIFAGVPSLLTAIALLASWMPAQRAAAMDPLEAIRSEV
jgi:putative ABC transport system permease protein